MVSSGIVDINAAWSRFKNDQKNYCDLQSFTRYLQPTEVISYDQGLFTVRAESSYSADWLRSRTSRVASQFISAELGEVASVEFVADQEEESDFGQLDSAENYSVNSTDHFLDCYFHLVKPNTEAVLSAYILRYLPVITATGASIYLALHQIAYERRALVIPTEYQGTEKKTITNKAIMVAAETIARRAGISLSTFRRWNTPANWEKFRGLVEKRLPHWVTNKNQDDPLNKNSFEYLVHHRLPLTPADARSLKRWLTFKIESGCSAVDAIQAATQAPVDELIPIAENFSSEGNHGFPLYVEDVIRDITGTDPMAAPHLREVVKNLIEHLMPTRDILKISLYFMKQHLPRLSPAQAWLIILLRDKTYANADDIELRDIVRIDGGYSELAQILKLDRPKTIYDWIRDTNVAKFVQLIKGDTYGLPFESAPRIFQIFLMEPTDDDPEMVRLLNSTDPDGGNENDIGETDIRSGESDTVNGEIEPLTIGENGTIDRRNWHSINLLMTLNKSQRISENSTNCERSVQKKRRCGWSFEHLPAFQKISSESKRLELETSGASPDAFVSWLIYAASPQGKGIDFPVLYAVSMCRRLNQTPREYLELAKLPPDILEDLINKEINIRWTNNQDWNCIMKGANSERLSQLANSLGLSVQKSF